jgi:hypothetical protein
MDDAEIVAAIAADDLGGLAAALERYAAPLYEYCHSLAPEAAVDAVHDTFIVAWCKLAELRDPRKLSAWLDTAAGNECFRRRLTSDDDTVPLTADPGPTLPPGLSARVLSECADETSAGRALRVWVTNRAGPFGADGFPDPHLPPRRHLSGSRRVTAAAAAAAVLTVAGSATAIMTSSGPRHTTASAHRTGRGPGTSAAATSGATLPVTPASSAERGVPTPRTSSSSATIHHNTTNDRTGTSQPVVMLATMPPAPAPTAQGSLTVNPPQLVLVSGHGGALAKAFLLSAENGPVGEYTITVPSGLPGSLAVSPASGSLAAGGAAHITVTATSSVPFMTVLTVDPGDILVQVTVKAQQPGDG